MHARSDFDLGSPEGWDRIQGIADLCTGIRREILFVVQAAGPEGIRSGRIAARLDLASNAVSQHMVILEQAGLVSCKQVGTLHIYRLLPGIRAERRGSNVRLRVKLPTGEGLLITVPVRKEDGKLKNLFTQPFRIADRLPSLDADSPKAKRNSNRGAAGGSG